MTRTNITIGLFGFGVVGQGLHAVLARTPGLRARIGRIAVKDRTKARPLPAELFTFDKQDLLNDPSLDVIVELIDNADEAYVIVKQALLNGKPTRSEINLAQPPLRRVRPAQVLENVLRLSLKAHQLTHGARAGARPPNGGSK